MSIAANKVKGIRAALCNDLYSAHVSREHNNANILCMGGRVIGEEVAKKLSQCGSMQNLKAEDTKDV